MTTPLATDPAPAHTASPPPVRFPWRLLLLIGGCTALLVLVIGYSFRLGHHMTAKYAPLVEAAQGIRIEATQAHLWLEEIISGDEGEAFSTVEGHLDAALTYNRLMLDGGTYRGTRYLPLSDPQLRRQVEQIRRDLQRFEAITHQRYQALGQDRPGSEIDRKFDATFHQFSAAADGVARSLKALIRMELAQFQQLQLSLILFCILLAVLLLLVLYRYERQRASHLAQIYRANQQLDRLSLTDGLTGIPNRRFFDQQYAQEWQRAQREQTPLTLVMLDIDYFKRYNDHYGHVQGDECLKRVASTIARFCQRSADTLARYGGEEFALILPNTAGAEAQVSRIRAAIAELKLPHARSLVSDYVSVSIGYCALVPQGDHTPEQLLCAADDALYQAKEAGRNCIQYCRLSP